jgi:hypothetical protein
MRSFSSLAVITSYWNLMTTWQVVLPTCGYSYHVTQCNGESTFLKMAFRMTGVKFINKIAKFTQKPKRYYWCQALSN